jgi:hypothetical protein
LNGLKEKRHYDCCRDSTHDALPKMPPTIFICPGAKEIRETAKQSHANDYPDDG